MARKINFVVINKFAHISELFETRPRNWAVSRLKVWQCRHGKLNSLYRFVGLKNNCLKAKTCTSTVNECRTRRKEDNKMLSILRQRRRDNENTFQLFECQCSIKLGSHPPPIAHLPDLAPPVPFSANDALKAGGKALELEQQTIQPGSRNTPASTRTRVCHKKLKCRWGNLAEWRDSYPAERDAVKYSECSPGERAPHLVHNLIPI